MADDGLVDRTLSELSICDLSRKMKVLASHLKAAKDEQSTRHHCVKFQQIMGQFLDGTRHDFSDQVSGLHLALEQFRQNKRFLKAIPEVNDLQHWLFLQSAKLVLSNEWQKINDDDENKKLLNDELNESFVKPSDGEHAIMKDILDQPWSNPVLVRILSADESLADEEVFEYFKSQDSALLKLRVDMLLDGGCENFAMNLTTWLVRLPRYSVDANMLSIHLMLLYRLDMLNDFHQKCSDTSCHIGVHILHRICSDDSLDNVSLRLSSTFLAQDLIRPSSYCCTRELLRIWVTLQRKSQPETDNFIQSIRKMSDLVKNSLQMSYFVSSLVELFGEQFLPLCVEFFTKAFHVDVVRYVTYTGGGNEPNPIDTITSPVHMCHVLNSALNVGGVAKYIELRRLAMVTAFSLNPLEDTLFILEGLFRDDEKMATRNDYNTDESTDVQSGVDDGISTSAVEDSKLATDDSTVAVNGDVHSSENTCDSFASSLDVDSPLPITENSDEQINSDQVINRKPLPGGENDVSENGPDKDAGENEESAAVNGPLSSKPFTSCCKEFLPDNSARNGLETFVSDRKKIYNTDTVIKRKPGRPRKRPLTPPSCADAKKKKLEEEKNDPFDLKRYKIDGVKNEIIAKLVQSLMRLKSAELDPKQKWSELRANCVRFMASFSWHITEKASKDALAIAAGLERDRVARNDREKVRRHKRFEAEKRKLMLEDAAAAAAAAVKRDTAGDECVDAQSVETENKVSKQTVVAKSVWVKQSQLNKPAELADKTSGHVGRDESVPMGTKDASWSKKQSQSYRQVANPIKIVKPRVSPIAAFHNKHYSSSAKTVTSMKTGNKTVRAMETLAQAQKNRADTLKALSKLKTGTSALKLLQQQPDGRYNLEPISNSSHTDYLQNYAAKQLNRSPVVSSAGTLNNDRSMRDNLGLISDVAASQPGFSIARKLTSAQNAAVKRRIQNNILLKVGGTENFLDYTKTDSLASTSASNTNVSKSLITEGLARVRARVSATKAVASVTSTANRDVAGTEILRSDWSADSPTFARQSSQETMNSLDADIEVINIEDDSNSPSPKSFTTKNQWSSNRRGEVVQLDAAVQAQRQQIFARFVAAQQPQQQQNQQHRPLYKPTISPSTAARPSPPTNTMSPRVPVSSTGSPRLPQRVSPSSSNVSFANRTKGVRMVKMLSDGRPKLVTIDDSYRSRYSHLSRRGSAGTAVTIPASASQRVAAVQPYNHSTTSATTVSSSASGSSISQVLSRAPISATSSFQAQVKPNITTVNRATATNHRSVLSGLYSPTSSAGYGQPQQSTGRPDRSINSYQAISTALSTSQSIGRPVGGVNSYQSKSTAQLSLIGQHASGISNNYQLMSTAQKSMQPIGQPVNSYQSTGQMSYGGQPLAMRYKVSDNSYTVAQGGDDESKPRQQQQQQQTFVNIQQRTNSNNQFAATPQNNVVNRQSVATSSTPMMTATKMSSNAQNNGSGSKQHATILSQSTSIANIIMPIQSIVTTKPTMIVSAAVAAPVVDMNQPSSRQFTTSLSPGDIQQQQQQQQSYITLPVNQATPATIPPNARLIGSVPIQPLAFAVQQQQQQTQQQQTQQLTLTIPTNLLMEENQQSLLQYLANLQASAQ